MPANPYQYLNDSLPLLCTRLAKRFGIQIRMQGSCAYTNGTTITIPRIVADSPEKRKIVIGYLEHEAGHCRFTNMKVVARLRKSPFRKELLNILEDSRIELLMSRSYVGAKDFFRELRVGKTAMADNANFAQAVKDGTAPDLSVLLESLLVYCQCRNNRMSELRPFAASMLRSVLNKKLMPADALRQCCQFCRAVPACKDTAAVSKLAKKLSELIAERWKEQVKDWKPKKQEQKIEDYPLPLQPPEKVKKTSLDDQLAQKSENFAHDLKKFNSETDSRNRSAYLPADRKLSDLVSSFAEEGMSARDDLGLFGKGEAAPGRADFIKYVKGDFRELANVLRKKLLAWISTAQNAEAQRGRDIDVYKAQLLDCGETDLFRLKEPETDYSTDVTLMIDCSGSMIASDGGEITRCEAACRTALATSLAFDGLDGSGIKNTVLCFPGRSKEVEIIKTASQKAFKHAAYFDQTARGSTPLAQAVYSAIDIADHSDCSRHVVIVLTDGMPDSVAQTESALGLGRSKGIEFYGVGIRLENIKNLIPKSEVIQSPAEITAAFKKILCDIYDPKRLGTNATVRSAAQTDLHESEGRRR